MCGFGVLGPLLTEHLRTVEHVPGKRFGFFPQEQKRGAGPDRPQARPDVLVEEAGFDVEERDRVLARQAERR